MGYKTSIEISKDNFDWLAGIQNALKAPTSRIYLWTRDPQCGIVGLARCLRKESGGDKVRCMVYPEDSKAPDFQSPSKELQKLIEKDVAISVYKDNDWGSFTHTPLCKSASAKSGTRNIFLCNPSRDGMSGAHWAEMPIRSHEQQYHCLVTHASLSLHDLTGCTGSRHILSNPLGRCGIEFSGHDYQGSRVMGITRFGSLSTYVRPIPEITWRVPDHWTLEDAATVPVAYSMAYWSLLQKGCLRRKQSVLIHSGVDGTGLAAIQVALSLGCEVFTTVGSPEGVEKLLTLFPQLRKETIGSSGDATFAEMVLTATQGKGVNVVLSSISNGELAEVSFKCVARGGKVVDISEAHTGDDTVKMNYRLLLKNVGYHNVCLNELQQLEMGHIVQVVQRGIETGTVVPLERSVFSTANFREAIQLTLKGETMGKVLIDMRRRDSVQTELRVCFEPMKMYVVIGGLGGIGFEFVNWLVERGARKVTIVSKSGQVNGYHTFNLRRWAKYYDATVTVIISNMENEESCQDLFTELEDTYGVAGIFISALVSTCNYCHRNVIIAKCIQTNPLCWIQGSKRWMHWGLDSG